MAEIVSVVIASLEFIHKIVSCCTSTYLGSTDIGDYERDPVVLAQRIQQITEQLYNVDEQQISPAQKRAFEKLREAVLDAEDILDRVETLTKKKKLKEVDDMVTRETNCKQICSSVYVSIKSFGNKAKDVFLKSDKVQNAIKEINEKLDVVKKKLEEFGPHEPSSIGLSRMLRNRASGTRVNAQKIMGRDEDKMEIIKLLLRCSTNKERIPVVSVVGMGGMGKTTLAQLVYHDKTWQEEFRFDQPLWVPDSKKLDFRSLLKSILKCISPSDTSLDSLDETHLKNRLVEEIREKRFFLVLDDADNETRQFWESLEDLLGEGNKERSRVLITTRSRTVAVVAGSSNSTYQLKGLSEEDSLQLFERCAFEGTRDENLVEIGKLIVKNCAGVPLALRVTGALLFNQKDKSKWEHVRDRGLGKDDDVMPILKMSYDDLDLTLKQCFSYCALFPKNYRISEQELSRIWMANVRFETEEGETLQYICGQNLKLLFNRCFLEISEREFRDDADDTYYKMHDLMHDLVIKVAGAEMVVADFDTRVDSNMLIIEENVRHLSLMSHPEGDTRTWTLKSKGRRLRTFIQSREGRSDFYDYCDPKQQSFKVDKLVSNYPFLRFLALRSCSIGNITNSIGELIHLRYLSLPHGEFKKLDSVAKLINLQHLILKGCKDMTQLPSEMGALISLELLDVSNCGKLTELPKDIHRLANLRCLKLASCYDITHLPSRMGALTSLQVLDISNCYELKELPMGIEKLTNLKDLNLERCWGLTQMPSGMGALVSVCRPHRLIVGHPGSQHTAQLEELASVSELKHGELEILLPYNITSKTLARDEDGYLINKKSLRKLEIEWKGEDSTEEEEEVPTNHRDILAKLQPPHNLKKFTLKRYQGETFPTWVPKDGFGSVLPNLVKIQIVSCNGCRNLPALSRLASLKHMELRWLSSLEYIEEDVSGTSFFPSLEKLVLEELPELKGWCRGEGLTTGTVEQEQSLMLPSFPRLLDLEISSCPNLKVEAILVSFVKVFSVKSTGEMEKELSEKREETMSSSGKPLALSSSSLALFVAICRDGAGFRLSMEEENHGHSLQFHIIDWKATGLKSIDMDNVFRQISKHLTHLDISCCSGLKTLTGLQHLTALQQLDIWDCPDFTGEEDEEEGKQMKSNSLQTIESSSSTCLEAASTQDVDNQWKSLQSLQCLYFSELPKMKVLPQGIQFLTSLQTLHIEDCDNLTLPEWVHTTFKHEDNGTYLRI